MTIQGMKHACLAAVVASVLVLGAPAKKGDSPFAGRWDLTVTTSTATYPAWIEVVDQDNGPAVRIQPRGGFVRPAAQAKLDGARLVVTISPATEDRAAITWEFTVKNNVLTGSIHRAAETQGTIAGVKA